jgi:hypothetical protein
MLFAAELGCASVAIGLLWVGLTYRALAPILAAIGVCCLGFAIGQFWG